MEVTQGYFTDPGLQEIRHHSSVCRCGIAIFNCIKTREPGEKSLEQGREPTTNTTHM